MKRVLAAALAALVCLSSAAQARGGGYYYIPIYIGPVAAVLPDPDVGNTSGIHKVALLSSLGASLNLRSTIGNTTSTIDISALKMDAEIGETLRKYLGGRFDFVDMPFDAAAINALPISYFREAKTTELVKALPNPGVDAYILVRPSGPNGGLELFMRGYNQVALFANYEIDVLNAHTGAYISKSVGRIADLPGEQAQFPAVSMPDDFWLNPNAGPEAARTALLHKYLTQLMKRSLVETIRSLQFGVALPPVGDHSIAEPVMADVLSGVRSVAVVSAVGGQLQMINPGNMLITRTDENMPITDWGLDDRIEAILRQALSPHYEIKPIHANREVIGRETVVGGARLGQIPGFDASTQVDAIVLVMPATENGRPYHGLGLLHWTPLMNREADVYADNGVVLLDAHNLRPVTGYVAVRGGASCAQAQSVRLGIPECRVDEKLFPDTGQTLKGDAADKVRKALDDLMVSSIPETLFHLGLNVDQPAAR